jgi:nicotinate phosphoribosyltransferase
MRETYGFGSGLLTDLYELAMAAGYVETNFEATATFELMVRSLPARRNFLVAAGLDQALDFLENFTFSSDEIAYLRGLPAFRTVSARFFEYLRDFRFRCDVWAIPEGTVVFAGEPLLRVTGPIAEAQIVETAMLALINFQTMIASKAARVCRAAEGRPIIEFGSRRAHGVESGVLAARAAYLAGAAGTSNTFAGQRFGVPVFGTQAHSWIMAHENEDDAFAEFVRIFGSDTTLLVDTYDVRAAVTRLIAKGIKPRAIRLDSGDLAADSIWAREKMDAAGWKDVGIFASGDLDEDRIAKLLAEGAKIDAFGVGTALSTSSDAPALGVIYKLVEVDRDSQVRLPAKFSEAKITYPGRKQVFRSVDSDGKFSGDVIGLENESGTLPYSTKPLLVQVMSKGVRVLGQPSGIAALAEARQRCAAQLAALPAELQTLEPARTSYPVKHSAGLEELLQQFSKRMGIDAAEMQKARGLG